MTKNILIATRDERVKGLRKELAGEFDVRIAEDGASALEITLREKPTLIIADMDDLPLIEGERLFHIVINNPQTRQIPFLFVGKKERALKDLRRNFDTFLSKPLDMPEVYRKIQQTISSLEFSETVNANREIEGKLSQLSLADLIQVLSLNRKEGILKVSCGGKEGKIYIKDGEIYDAILDTVRGEKAFYRLLTWKDGSFGFYPCPVGTPKRIKASTNNLVIEGLRQYDEWEKNKDTLPDRGSLLHLKVPPSELPRGLKPIFYDIVRLLDFCSTVEEVLDRCDHPDMEIYRALSAMIKQGILEEVRPDAATEAFQELLTTYEALQICRRLSLNGDDPGWGRILFLSFEPSSIKDFLTLCKGIRGLHIDPLVFEELKGDDFMGEIGSLRTGDVEFVLMAMSPHKKMRPLWNLLTRHAVGAIFLWNENTLSRMIESLEFRRFLESHNALPVLNIVMLKTRKSLQRLPIREKIYTLTPGEDPAKAVWIIYNLFGAFLRLRSRDVC